MVTPLTILHEDDSLIAVAKPAGIATANVPAGEESVFSILRTMVARRRGRGPVPGGGGGRKPANEGASDAPFIGVVSRLDKPVSGVVVLAKSPGAAASLSEQFRDRSVAKVYYAIVEGRFPAPLGQWVDWHDEIERPERTDGPQRSRGSKQGPISQSATLRGRVVKRLGEVSLVELHPVTGRRHQLRAQLASRGCPILGDRMYGARLPFPDGIALHARELTFSHPFSGETLRIVAGFPEAWRPRFASLLAGLPADRPSAER